MTSQETSPPGGRRTPTTPHRSEHCSFNYPHNGIGEQATIISTSLVILQYNNSYAQNGMSLLEQTTKISSELLNIIRTLISKNIT